MGKIIAYCREGCHYSNNSKNVLTDIKNLINTKLLNNENNNLEVVINIIPNTDNDKNNIKQTLKSIIGNHSTFPIIIYESSKENKYFIGGDSDLVEIMNFVNSFNNDNYNKDNLSTYISNKLTNTNLNNEGKRRLIYNLLLLKNKLINKK